MKRFRLFYTWFGVAFIWISAFFAQLVGERCSGICPWVPFVFAAGISAVVMWIVACNAEGIRKN